MDPSPGRLVPGDLLAPAFLDAPVPGRKALAMLHGEQGSPYRILGDAIAAAVERNEAQDAAFEDRPLNDDDSPWQLVVAAFEACQHTSGIKTTTVSKILHRKLPNLMPINDRLVRRFYGVPESDRWNLWESIYDDMNRGTVAELLDRWRDPYELPDSRPMSRLRALDIAVWMHESTNCQKGS